MASLTQWTWVWVNSGSWWWTGRPGVLRFMGSQRVGHDWATELNWLETLNCFFSCYYIVFGIIIIALIRLSYQVNITQCILLSWLNIYVAVQLFNIINNAGNSLVVQWLGFHTFTDEGSGLIPGWETKILQALQQGQKKKKRRRKLQQIFLIILNYFLELEMFILVPLISPYLPIFISKLLSNFFWFTSLLIQSSFF